MMSTTIDVKMSLACFATIDKSSHASAKPANHCGAECAGYNC